MASLPVTDRGRKQTGMFEDSARERSTTIIDQREKITNKVYKSSVIVYK